MGKTHTAAGAAPALESESLNVCLLDQGSQMDGFGSSRLAFQILESWKQPWPQKYVPPTWRCLQGAWDPRASDGRPFVLRKCQLPQAFAGKSLDLCCSPAEVERLQEWVEEQDADVA